MAVTVDGAERSLPLQPTMDERAAQLKAMGIHVRVNEDGTTTPGDLGPEGMAGLMAWFADFCATYLGDAVRDAGADDLGALKAAWDAERERTGALPEGEA